jgi:environmental stress-induced protein Ves
VVHRFERAHLRSTPWKNGRGVTHEIARWPEPAATHDFEWRVSIATIDADGPFSTFPGVDRVIVLLDEADVRLRSADGRVDERLEPLVAFHFDGETELHCMVTRTSTDFNVMTRRDAWRAHVDTLCRAQSLSASPSGVLFAVRGTWEVSATAADLSGCNGISVGANAGLWWHHTPRAWSVAPRETDAALLAVRLWRREFE